MFVRRTIIDIKWRGINFGDLIMNKIQIRKIISQLKLDELTKSNNKLKNRVYFYELGGYDST